MNKTLILFLFSCVSIGFNGAFSAITQATIDQTSRFRITNQCDKTLWIQQDYKNKTNDPIVVEIPKGAAYDYDIPDAGLASTRFWPKSDCNSHGYNCIVGESTGVPDAERQGFQSGPYAPDINSKFEATWGCLKAIFDNNPALCAVNPSNTAQHLNADTWWNGSAVDGYTFPYAINVKNHNSTCMDLNTGAILANPGVNCGQLSIAACPTDTNLSTEGLYNQINGVDVTHVNLQWIDPRSSTPTGCFSPCSKLTTAQGSDNGQTGGGWHTILGGIVPQSPQAQMYCCPTPPVSSGACSAGAAARSSYSASVHTVQQCDAYTYAYDDAKGLARCGSQSRFEVVFCPKTGSTPNVPPPIPTQSVMMRLIIPVHINVLVDGVVVGNNQSVGIANNSILSMAGGTNSSCSLAVSAASQVSKLTGSLCAQLTIDNNAKTITVASSPNTPPAPTNANQVQFDMNTAVGITAYINDALIVNATPMAMSALPKRSVLKASQGTKQGSCSLVINSDSIDKGAGDLCLRLNIVKDGGGKLHVYLPADIPNMGTVSPPPVKPKYIVFGMAPNVYAYFKSNLVTNGSEILLSSLAQDKQINLTAYQSQNSASCIIGKTGDTLSIVPNTGLLCDSGLVLMTESDGDYFIGLPNPLPVRSGSKAFGLGIAQGMSVTINKQVIAWNSVNKSVSLSEGITNIYIKGNNKTVRNCPVTRYGSRLTWQKTAACTGLVYNGGIIYFPAF